jgi:hypothetical protein
MAEAFRLTFGASAEGGEKLNRYPDLLRGRRNLGHRDGFVQAAARFTSVTWFRLEGPRTIRDRLFFRTGPSHHFCGV